MPPRISNRILLFLVIAGLSLQVVEFIVVTQLEHERITLIQKWNVERVAIAWISLVFSPVLSYFVCRFALLRAWRIGVIWWLSQAYISIGIGVLLGHAIFYRIYPLVLDVLQVLAGIGALQACRDVASSRSHPKPFATLFGKFQLRGKRLVASWYFIVAFGFAQCIGSGLILQSWHYDLKIIALGMGTSLLVGVVSGAVIAWMFGWSIGRINTRKGDIQ